MKKDIYFLACLACLFCSSSFLKAQTITTFAGTVASGFSGDSGPATIAQLFHPKGCGFDDSGNVYIADADNNVVRKVNPAGTITTIAGVLVGGYSGDGFTAIAAGMSRPNSVAFDRYMDMYICDADNHVVRKVGADGIIHTIAGDGSPGFLGDGGPATAGELDFPGSLALDKDGNIYIADEYNNRIRKVDTFGVITTYAGSGATGFSGEGGMADTAAIGFPFGVAVDTQGNVYFSLTLDNRICKVSTTHVISTAAGIGGGGAFSGDGGPATAAEFDNPWGIAVDHVGNLYIADNANERIRKVDVSTGMISTVAGTGSAGFFGDGSPATLAKLRDPAGVNVDGGGSIYISDYNNHRVRKVKSPLTHPPHFAGGANQVMLVCENAAPQSINSVLAVIDTDAGQVETWITVRPPTHGTLVALYSMTSTGGTVTTSGLTYTPAAGYTGNDTFRVRVSDYTATDTTTVVVTVNSCALTSPGLSKGEEVLRVTPNPSSGTFSMLLSSQAQVPAHVTVTNMVGEKVKEIMTTTNTLTEIKLDEAVGIYFLNVTTVNGRWSEKVTVAR